MQISEFYQMTPWEFASCVAGWNKAHGDGKPPPPTEEEFDRAIAEGKFRGMMH